MYERKQNVVTRQIGGETVLIPISQAGVSLQHVYLLNETAGAIWGLLATPHDLESLTAALLEQYEAPEETVREGCRQVLAELLERGFVTEESHDG